MPKLCFLRQFPSYSFGLPHVVSVKKILCMSSSAYRSIWRQYLTCAISSGLQLVTSIPCQQPFVTPASRRASCNTFRESWFPLNNAFSASVIVRLREIWPAHCYLKTCNKTCAHLQNNFMVYVKSQSALGPRGNPSPPNVSTGVAVGGILIG